MWHNARLLNLFANTLYGVAALLLFIAFLGWLAQRPMFTLQQIRVEGWNHQPLRHLNLPSIKATAMPRLRGNFFNVNLAQVRSAFEMVPWVRQAHVRRIWPNRLLVEIEEHHTLATWADGRLVNTHGELFVVNLAEAEEENTLYEFIGIPGSEKRVTQYYYALNQILEPTQQRIEKLVLSERDSWQAYLNNHTLLALGREQAPGLIEQRVQRFVVAYPQIQNHLAENIEYADLRYPNGFSIRAKGLHVLSDTKPKSGYQQ